MITINAVEKVELETYKHKQRQLEIEVESKLVDNGLLDLRNHEIEEIERTVPAIKEAQRLEERYITITYHSTNATKALAALELPFSYKRIRDLHVVGGEPPHLSHHAHQVEAEGEVVQRKN